MKRLLLLSSFLICLVFIAGAKSGPAKPAEKADLALRHGRIYTMDAARSWAESIAIKNGRIEYVGDDAGIAAHLGDKTEVIELKGRMVLPGFIDAHVHPVTSGVALLQLDLEKYQTKEEILKAIQEYAEAHPDLEWIIGGTWQLPVFPAANPRKEWLDKIIPDKPVLLSAADGHSAWVNSKAFELAGITRETPDPENGRIERDQNREPSGTLRESAMDLVYKVAPKATVQEQMDGLQQALRYLNGYGVTGFVDASVSEEELKTYQEADNRGILTANVTATMYADPEPSENIRGEIPADLSENSLQLYRNSSPSLQPVLHQIEKFKRFREMYRGKNLRTTSVKIFEDGVIEANTAAMLHPYLDKANDAGKLNWEPEKLNPMVQLLDAENFQIHIHAIGDRAIRVALTAIEAASKNNGFRDRRPLLAHIELIDPNDIPRFAQLAVIPTFQPLWAWEDPYIKDLTLPKLGPQRSRWIYPMQSVANHGAVLAMGSDWNVSSGNPLDGIEVSVTRRGFDAEDKDGAAFIPEERLSLAAALAAYTIGSAYATYQEREAGSVENGKSADLLVLSQNLFEIGPAKINETKVLLTLLDGKPVHRDPSWK